MLNSGTVEPTAMNTVARDSTAAANASPSAPVRRPSMAACFTCCIEPASLGVVVDRIGLGGVASAPTPCWLLGCTPDAASYPLGRREATGSAEGGRDGSVTT